MRYTLTLTLTLALCFAAQSLALHMSGGRTAKSESNFFSSLGRIQAGAQGRPEVMVLGSSITGRLPDRAQGFQGWANMGCDGGSAVDALRAMDEGILPAAPLLVIEANTLHMALDGKPTEIGQAMQRPWFKAGLFVQGVAAYARPAAFFYSMLLTRKIGDFEGRCHNDDLGVKSKPELVKLSDEAKINQREKQLVNEVVMILDRLRARGSKAVIIWMPPARPTTGPPPAWIIDLASRSDSPYWDIGQDADPVAVILTDGVHMASSSAARTMITLMGHLP